MLPIAQAARDAGYRELFVPQENASEAALIPELTIYPVKTLHDVVQHLDDNLIDTDPETGAAIRGEQITPQPPTKISVEKETSFADFSYVKGQESAKRGLEIAAAGRHNVAMYGPPGTGKTMLARAFSGILPALHSDAMLDVTSIHSIAGTSNRMIITQPTFRSPHHTSSYVSVIGGGAHPKPGEVTLAHHGILFLDEFPEFDKRVIESLRQPLEDRIVQISRASGTAQFPADFILIAAMNPCPCGYRGSRTKRCQCTPGAIERYKRKMSGPIMDRIDIWLEVEHIEYEKLSDKDFPKGEPSEHINERVIDARSTQWNRQGKHNAQLSAKDMESIQLSDEVQNILNQSAKKLALSPRAYHRVIKLARTIADLDHASTIAENHILEALQYRPKIN